MRKRFKFIKDFTNNTGNVIPKGTIIDIIDDRIFMSHNTGGGQVLDRFMYEQLHSFIEKEYKNPNFLKEIAVPYNKV